MKLKAFSIYDSKAFAYLPPYFMAEKGMAAREFTNAARDEKGRIGMNPEDYFLFCIGEFDDQTGVLVPFKEPESMGSALSFLKPEEVQ